MNFRAIINFPHRELIVELTKRELKDRYAGHVLGSAWAILNPLLLIALYLFLFTVVFPVRFSGAWESSGGIETYILSGLLPWLTFQEVLTKSCTGVRSNANLVKQVVFPIVVLPVKTVLASLLGQIITLVIFLIYIFFRTDRLDLVLLIYPAVMGLQILAMLGAAYALSAIGVFIKDVKDVVSVFAMANLFLQPILFAPEQIPGSVRWLLYLNPFTYLTLCSQDVLFFNEIAHPTAWVVLALISACAFLAGRVIFRKTSHLFSSVL